MRPTFLCALVSLVSCLAVDAFAALSERGARPTPAVSGRDVRESSVAPQAAKTSTSFYLYGAPGSGEGDFENALGGPSFDGWVSEDLTEGDEYWQLSTFEADNLNDHGEGNIAYWCGQSASQQPGWAAAPGYGNSWDQRLEWASGPLVDPSVGQVVGLEFAFNHASEPGYDFLRVEYFKGSTWVQVAAVDGSNVMGVFPNRFFPSPGVQYPADVINVMPIVFDGNDYGGPNGDRILMRLRFTSDGAWSNEDGLFPSYHGACQVDDLRVSYDDGAGNPQESFSDLDVTNEWAPDIPPFAGDFADVLVGFIDIDECRDDHTGIVTFVDDGSCPRNPHNNFGQAPCESTGGEPPVHSPTYGVPGGWIVNWHGGLTQGIETVQNRVVSPSIAWDLPGTGDDDPAFRGLTLRFDVWRHLPLDDGIFYRWHLRTSADGGTSWSRWFEDIFVYFGENPAWITHEDDLTDRLPDAFTHLQVGLVVTDLAGVFGLPGMGGTPSPAFDNVQLLKYRLDGPMISVPHVDLWQDAFPPSGQASYHTLADRANADVRLDVARDLGGVAAIAAGDSVVVDVVAAIPGTTIDTVEMVWVLDKNPKFDDVRVIPSGTTIVTGGALNGWDQWTGILVGRHPTDLWGPIPDKFFFDLPDQDFFHPGDVLRYYVRARDDQGRVATVPADIDGFATGRAVIGRYSPPFTVHALPSATDDGQGGWTQARILWVDAAGHRGGGNDRHRALDENGWVEGGHYDVYTVLVPTTTVQTSNGIGSAGAYGATAEQLAGYQMIVHEGGDLDAPLRTGKSDDVAVLRAWFEQDDDRALAHFGDDLASSLTSLPGGSAYLQDVLGVDVFGDDVRGALGGESNPVVWPAQPYFATEYAAYGGCLYVNETDTPDHWPTFDLTARQFDDIGPRAGAVYGHWFLEVLGQPYPGPGGAASVIWDRTDGNGNRKTAATFPYGFQFVWEEPHPDALVSTVRTRLAREVIEDAFGVLIPNPGVPVTVEDTPGLRGLRDLASAPNPFNPRVRIRFEIGRRSAVQAEVFNIRGERVLTLLDEVRPAGRIEVVWDGRDRRGTEIASGVYFVRVRGDGQSRVQKVALVR